MTKAMKKQPFFLPFGGCRGRCVFCNQRAITGVDEVPSPQFVSSILKNLTEPVEVCYFGGSFCRFTFEKIKEYLDAVVNDAPKGSRIRFSTYPGDLQNKKLRSMVLSYPIACVELGIQSLDSEVLSQCRREADPVAILENMVVLRDENVPLSVQLMIGLPGQTVSSSIYDINKIAEIKGESEWQFRLYPCLVIENTELYEMMNSGEYTPLTVDEAVKWGGRVIDVATSLGFTPIRAGLQESEMLASQVRGGPHHPALGELMFSESIIRKLIRLNPKGPWVLPSSNMSKFTGHRGYGLNRLAELTSMPEKEVAEKLTFFPAH